MLILKIKKIRPLKNLLSSRLFQLGCVSVFIFLLAPPAYAEEANTPTMISLATMLFYILNLVINAIAGLATAMDLIFSVEITGINGQSIQVVQTTWALVRNFSNMFFILGLIIMAFATIFDVSRYNFRTLIVRFLIVALLINFSLTIGETIIDWTQSLSSVFLTAMGSYGNLLGGPLDPAMLLGEPSGILGSIRPFLYRLGGVSGAAGVFLTFAADSNLFAQVTQMFFSIILGSIIAFSLLVGVIFTAIRIPILWALLILAPAAWVCSIFPPLADANRNWWKHFLGWNFFLPIYLFFLYVGMLFLQAQSNITTPILPAGATDPLTGLGFSFQTIFFYGFVAMFMISGVKFAMKGGQYFGTSGVAAAIWAKGRATARYAGALPYRGVSAGVGAAWRGTGAEGVYKDTKQTFKEQGFAGFEATEKTLGKFYQGQQGRDKAAVWLGGKIKDITGVDLAPGLAEKQTQRNIQAAEERFKSNRSDEGYLSKVASGEISGTMEERIGASNLLKGMGQNIKGKDLAQMFKEYRQRSPAEAVRWIRGQNIDGLDKEGLLALEQVALEVNDPQLRQKISRIKTKRNIDLDTESFAKTIKDRFGENTNEAELVGLLGENPDFINALKPPEIEKILEAIPDKFQEARKKFALQVADKGFNEDQLVKLTGKGPRAAFDSDSTLEIEKFLDKVRQVNPLAALKRKQELGLLKDLNTGEELKGGTPKELELVLSQVLGKLNAEELNKIKSRIDPETGKESGFANPTMLSAYGRSLIDEESIKTRITEQGTKQGKTKEQIENQIKGEVSRMYRQAQDKVENLYRDNRFVQGSAFGYLDPVLEEIREKAFDESRGKEFKQNVSMFTDTIMPEIVKAKDNKNFENAETEMEKAREVLKQASDKLKTINNLDYVKSSTKESFTVSLSEAKRGLARMDEEIKTLKEEAKKATQAGKKKDNEPPPDDKGGKGGGGGSSGGGSPRGSGGGSSSSGGSGPRGTLPPGWSPPGGGTSTYRPPSRPEPPTPESMLPAESSTPQSIPNQKPKSDFELHNPIFTPAPNPRIYPTPPLEERENLDMESAKNRFEGTLSPLVNSFGDGTIRQDFKDFIESSPSSKQYEAKSKELTRLYRDYIKDKRLPKDKIPEYRNMIREIAKKP